MVTQYGMSDAGLMAYPMGDSELSYQKPYSPQTETLLESEINKIINTSAEKARSLVREHKTHIDNIAKALLEKETIDLLDIISIIGDRPFPLSESIKDYLKEIENSKKIREEEARKEKEEQDNKDENNSKDDKDNKDDKKDDDHDKKLGEHDKDNKGKGEEDKKGGVGPTPKNENEKKIEEAETIIKIRKDNSLRI